LFTISHDKSPNCSAGQKSGGSDFYDVWSSYRLPGTVPLPAAFRAAHYQIETTIRPGNSINGVTTVRIHTDRSGERLIPFQFSGLLTIEAATLAGESLFTFPDGSTTSEREWRAETISCSC